MVPALGGPFQQEVSGSGFLDSTFDKRSKSLLSFDIKPPICQGEMTDMSKTEHDTDYSINNGTGDWWVMLDPDSKGDTRAAAHLYSVPEQTLQHEHSHLGEVATQALRPGDTLCPYIMMRSGTTPYRGQPDFWTSPQCTSGAREWLKLVVET